MNKTLLTAAAAGLLVAALSGCSLPGTGIAAPAGNAGQVLVSPETKTTTFTVGGSSSSVLPGTFDLDVPQRDLDRVLSDADAVQPLLDDFWARELSATYGLDFDTPDRFEYYVGDEYTTCGGEDAGGEENAYYCFADDDEHVAFDAQWLATYLDEDPGDATTFLVLAHEWGHAVQDTWIEQEPDADYWAGPAQELNADCLAGVFWDNAVREGTLIEEEGDAEAVFQFLYDAGSGTWMDPGDHGSPEQRQLAFADGYNYGTDYCRTNY
jgi:uncharacterized protein